MDEKRFERIRWVLFALTAAVSAALFWPAIEFSMAMFADPVEDMSYGWLIAPVSVYMIWQRRDRLRAAEAGLPGAWGVPACLLGFAMLWLGHRGGQARLMQFGLAWMVFALPLAFWGWRLARWLVFPAAYLLFIVPMSFLDGVTFPLRLMSSTVSAGVLNGIGIGVQQVGTSLVGVDGAGFRLDVADPCSGIRSLIAIAALTTAYAGLHRMRFWARVGLMASAVPLAFLGNVVRLVSTAVVARFWGERAGIMYHDQAGFLVFPLVVLGVLVTADWLKKREKREAAVPEDEIWVTERAGRKMARLFIVPTLVFVLALAALGVIRGLPNPVAESDAFVAREMPRLVGTFTATQPWYCQDETCLHVATGGVEPDAQGVRSCPLCGGALAAVSLAERTVLPADTRILKAIYRSSVGRTYHVTVVVSGKSRMSIHRPEMCLPGQGFAITRNEIASIPLGGGRTLSANVVQAGRGGETPIGFIYWFANPRKEAVTHWDRIFSDVWARSVRNQINRWCMVTVNADRPFDEEGLAELGAFLDVWYPQVVVRSGAEAAAR